MSSESHQQQGNPSNNPALAGQPSASGVAGDFNFLDGEWKIRNRRLQEGSWDEFEGEATVHSILNGLVSVEELRIPARDFSGMGLRVLDLEKKLWADYWVNGKAGVQHGPTWGGFVSGIGTWESNDTDNGSAIIVRGVWDRITPDSCRWYQAVSSDGGNTWQENWIMHWTRA